jgi:hypothetical protein
MVWIRKGKKEAVAGDKVTKRAREINLVVGSFISPKWINVAMTILVSAEKSSANATMKMRLRMRKKKKRRGKKKLYDCKKSGGGGGELSINSCLTAGRFYC